MSYAENIRSAPSPSAALLMIAEALDDITARIAAVEDSPAGDGWGAWDDPAEVEAMPAMPVVDNTEAIAAVKAELATATGQDRQALEARLRLLQDDGQALDTAPPAGRQAVSQEVGDQIVTTLPTPNGQRQQARRAFVEDSKLWEFSVLPEAPFTDAFVKGGPLWLYHTARDEVMSMPYDWRQWLVADISLDSPRTAQEVGRDILKDEGTGNKEVAADVLGVNIGDE